MNPVPHDPNFKEILLGFHADEDGMEAMQVVMVVAIAAVILYAFAKFLWPTILNYTKNAINQFQNIAPDNGA
jgi:hypothetical protein